MKCFLAGSSRLAGDFVAGHAQGPDDQYVKFYNLIQEADAMDAKAQSNQALAKYLGSANRFATLQKGYPEWNAQS